MDYATRDILMINRDDFLPGFAAWLVENWHVWVAFDGEASKVWSRGRRRYSARTIWEVLRHESVIREVSGKWKMNDRNVPDCARLYMLVHERAGFFETRLQASSERAA